MGVITEEIELPDPSQLRLKRPVGDRNGLLLLGIGGAAGALLMYALTGAPSPETPAPAVAAPQKKALGEAMPPATKAPEPKPEPKPEPEPEAMVATRTITPIRTGEVSIRSEPRAVVYAGDRRLGRTPLEAELDAGVHELRLVNRKLHLDVKRRVRIGEGRTRSVDLLFGTSKLVLSAPDGTKVRLDNRFVGRTPLKPIELVEGRHRLELRFGEQRLTERLDVPPSRTIDYRARFPE